ncbi:hypothetical protein [Streptomyces sp. NPDC060027]|uniref:hypothetical protein n=1 Tax=Streptomyces sp. NPDC060027 TaxID=3347040 RepID=UPI003697142A
MTPWLRTLPTAGLLAAALLNGAGHLAYAAPARSGTASYAAAPVPSARGTAVAVARGTAVAVARGTAVAETEGPAATDPTRPTPTADPSRAGSFAGEGRSRPGRTEPDLQDTPDATDPEDTGPGADAGLTEPSLAPEPSRNDAVPVQQSVVGPASPPEPVLEILPLGSGLILIGLGLGLAFVALRVRRG